MGHGAYHVFFYTDGRPDAEKNLPVSRDGEDDDVLKPFREWYEGLDNVEQVCWSYGIKPSDYDLLASTEIWYDVYYQIKVRLGEITASHLQQHYAMLQVLGKALGGDTKSKPGRKVNDMNPEEAVRTLDEFFKI